MKVTWLSILVTVTTLFAAISPPNVQSQTIQPPSKLGEKLEKQIKNRPTQLSKPGAVTGKSVLKSIKIVKEQAANKVLSNFNPANNLASQATAFSTKSWDNHPRILLRDHRPNSLSSIPKPDFWAFGKKTGWLKVKWKNPVKASKILLINRPGNAKGVWVKALVKINDQELVEIKNFAAMSVCLIEMKEPVELKDLRIECTKGRNYPGLYSLEVYR